MTAVFLDVIAKQMKKFVSIVERYKKLGWDL